MIPKTAIKDITALMNINSRSLQLLVIDWKFERCTIYSSIRSVCVALGKYSTITDMGFISFSI
jgi:hypothetical protein